MARQPLLTAVRGRGLMIGLDFADHDVAVAVEQECFRRGVLVLTCGERTVRLAPPLVIRPDQVDTAWPCWRRRWRPCRPVAPGGAPGPHDAGGSVLAEDLEGLRQLGHAPREQPPGGPQQRAPARRGAARGRSGPARRSTVAAAVRLLTTASSDASTTAANSGFRSASSMGLSPAAGTVLKAAKISPLPW